MKHIEIDDILSEHPHGRITEPTGQHVHLTWTTKGSALTVADAAITASVYVGVANHPDENKKELPIVGSPSDIFSREPTTIPKPVRVQTLLLDYTQKTGLAILIKNPELIKELKPQFVELANTVSEARRASGEFFGAGDNPAGRALRDEVIAQLCAKAKEAEVLRSLLRTVTTVHSGLAANAEQDAHRLFPQLY